MSDYWGASPQQPDRSEPAGRPQPDADRWGNPVQGQPEILSNRPGAYPAADSATCLPASAPTYLGTGDILSDAPAPRPRSRGRLVAIGAGVLAVAGIGVGAAYAAGAFGSHGAQPETLVPASAVGYFSVDLDPGLGQKVDALRFLRKFPSANASLGTTDDIRKWAFEQATKDDGSLSQLSYETDVKPWIGDRFGLAVVPAARAGAEPSVVVVIQVSDEDKARAGLKKLITDPKDGSCSVASGYAVCAETAQIVSSVQAAAAKHSLADDPHFKADLHAIGSRGIALGWGDGDKITSLLPKDSTGLDVAGVGGLPGTGLFGGLGRSGQAGRVVATLRFSGADLELTGRSVGGSVQHQAGSPGTGVEQLPNTTVGALGVSLDDQAVAKGYAAFQQQLKAAGGPGMFDGVEQQLAAMGFHLPQDLAALVGTKFDVAFGGIGGDRMPQVGIRSNADAAQAGRVLDRLTTQLARSGVEVPLHHVPAGKGYAAALDQGYADQLAAGGHLGDQDDFTAAVPDAAKAQFVFYLNVARLVSGGTLRAFAPDEPVDPNLKALASVGMSAAAASDGSATLRLKVTTR